MKKGYFSVVQYCPDRGRMETGNVGLLVTCPELDQIETAGIGSFVRLKNFFGFGMFKDDAVAMARDAVLHALDRERPLTQEAIDAFAAKLANDIVMTPARPCVVEHGVRETFDRMWGELVL